MNALHYVQLKKKQPKTIIYLSIHLPIFLYFSIHTLNMPNDPAPKAEFYFQSNWNKHISRTLLSFDVK